MVCPGLQQESVEKMLTELAVERGEDDTDLGVWLRDFLPTICNLGGVLIFKGRPTLLGGSAGFCDALPIE